MWHSNYSYYHFDNEGLNQFLLRLRGETFIAHALAVLGAHGEA